MEEITPNAARFIDWAMQQLEDESYYQQSIQEIKDRLAQHYAQPKDVILAQLKAKITRGGIEHGEPYYSEAQLQKELTNEYIDLMGWMLIEKWNQQSKDN